MSRVNKTEVRMDLDSDSWNTGDTAKHLQPAVELVRDCFRVPFHCACCTSKVGVI